jgi:hypothetical protein
MALWDRIAVVDAVADLTSGGSMAQHRKGFKLQKRSGEAVTVGDVTATPQAQSLTVSWPHGGWVWNRPVAVLVERGEETKRIPVVDVTRMVQLGLYGLSLVLAIVGLVIWTKEGSASDE